ncbi:MAG: hypothetical protein QGF67_01395 [Lentisphaeria bacterium]|jgi:hypothetical protein|nr:hypothetical protein [Lentisphaeria bacterium]MDP7740066.1 hypothetical protein [Lentisphaeria bacterium]
MKLKRSIITVATVIVLIVGAIFVTIGLQQPSLSVEGLPNGIDAGAPFIGKLIVVNPRHYVIDVSSSRGDLEIDPESFQIRWPSPPPGSYNVAFTLHRKQGDRRTVVDEKIWPVLVAGNIPGKRPPEPENIVADTAGPPATDTIGPAPPPAAVEPPPTAVEPRPAPPVEPATGPGSTAAVEPVPVQPMTLTRTVGKLPDEVSVSLPNGQQVFGRGRPGNWTPRQVYLRGLLSQVRYVYDFPDDPVQADADVGVLLQLGAGLADTEGPFTIALNDRGRAAMQRRKTVSLRLPAELWGAVLRTTNVVAVVNHGRVRWRLAAYEPRSGAYAVVVGSGDIQRQ